MKKTQPKKKLLIYAHYYFPDVASTGQIVKELAEGMLDTFEITIICVVPSYTGKIPEVYRSRLFYKEEVNGINLIRIRVPEFQKENKISRIINIISYFIGAIFATFNTGKIDYVYSISQPPILGGLLGVIGKLIKKSKFIYNVQDFNPEQILAVGYSKNKIILKLMMFLDKISCKYSDKVIVVGRDMVDTLENRFIKKPTPSCTFINNWTDEEEIYPLPPNHSKVLEFKKKYNLEHKFVFMYSGNIGLYYDLENLIRVISKFKLYDEVVFAFIGEGTVKNKLVSYKEKYGLKNVRFIPYQEKSNLIYSLNAGDIHWCVNATGIKGVSVPSKLYGILSVGKPVLGVLEKGSEARLIIEETDCGFVTEPENYDVIEEIIKTIINDETRTLLTNKGENGRRFLLSNLTKDVSVGKYIKEIMSS